MSDSVVVSLITSVAAVLVAFIGAWASSGKAAASAVAAAIEPRDKKIETQQTDIAEQGVLIQRLREMIIELKGDPDEA